MELRKGGEYYQVSPWALSWDDENYYLVAYDSKEEKIKHYRMGKMLHLSQAVEAREGQKSFERFDTAIYAKKMFSMYAGDEENVKLECENGLAGAIIDRFGKEVSMRKIVGPERVVEVVREEVKRLGEQYN